MIKTTIILPTYNEKENIGPLIEAIETVFRQIRNHSMSILVVDDNSPDGTAAEVKAKQKKYENLHLITGKKEGLGKAYLRGMDYASDKLGAEVMFEMDADFSHDPKLIPKFLEKIDQGYDLVVGSRYIKGGSIPSNWGIHRKTFSIFGNLIVRTMLFNFSQHEWTNGYRAIRTNLYQKIRNDLLDFTGYTFQVASLHKAQLVGAKIAEIPNRFVDRVYGKSKIGKEYIINLLKYLILTDLTNPPRFFRFLVVGTIGFVTQATLFAVFKRLTITEIANAIGFSAAVTSNFLLNNFWTFSDRKKHLSLGIIPDYVKFYIFSIGALIIQTISISTTKFIFGHSEMVDWGGFVLGVLIGLFVNYTIYNKIIWKKKKSS